MIDQGKIGELEQTLFTRRQEIIDLRASLGSSRANLQEPENEMEAMAGKETLLDDLERQDNRLVDELRKIDNALSDIEGGRYGRCRMCDRPISIKRLQAIPWAIMCKRCAQQEEAQFVDDEDDEEEPIENESLFQEEISDDSIEQMIWDELDGNEALNVEQLDVHCENGTVFLGGSLSTEQEHQLVLEAVEETLGFDDVIDRIAVRRPGRRVGSDTDPEEEEIYEKERSLYGEPAEDDPFAAEDENEPMIPPDRILPEEEA